MQSAWRAALLLLVASWGWGAVRAAGGQPAGSRVCQFECGKFSPPVSLHSLQSYKRTNCGKPGVLLTTKKNRILCANPNEKWVLDVMRELDAKNAPRSSTVDTLVPKGPGRFDKLLGSGLPVSTQAGGSAYPTETFSTAAYGLSAASVTRAEDPKSFAVTSSSAGTQVAKPSVGSTSKPEVVVSRTTMQPEPLANRSTPSYFTDGPKSFGEGLAPAGKGLEGISGSVSDLVVPPTSLGTNATETVDNEDRKVSPTRSTHRLSSTVIYLLKKNSTSNDGLLPPDQQGSPIKQVTDNPTGGLSTVPQRRDFTSLAGTQASPDGSLTNSAKNKSDIVSAHGAATDAPFSTRANGDAFSKSLGTLSHSGSFEERFMEKSRGEATMPSPEGPLTFLPSGLARYQSHIISVVFLVFTFCIYLAVPGVCVKSHICARAPPIETVRGLTYSRTDPQTSAYALQVL